MPLYPPILQTGGIWDSLLLMIVMITVNVGILICCPLPALDGGRLIFLIIEGIFRQTGACQKYEGWIHAAGFMLLIGTYADRVLQ